VFTWPQVKAQVTVDGVLVVVDAPGVLAGLFATDPAALARQRAADPALSHDESPLEELFEEQLLCADLVLVNKADQVSADELDRIAAAIRPICGPQCSDCGLLTEESIRSSPLAWESARKTTC
jgi:cobalamin biosynthesis protein CobW